MSHKKRDEGEMDELDAFLNDVSSDVELIDPSTVPYSGHRTIPSWGGRVASADTGTVLCAELHRGHRLKGIPSLMGSSLRDGLAIPGDSVTVILARETLQVAFPAGWASYRSSEFDSHLRGALVFWPWKDYDAPADIEQSVRRVLELHEIHRSGKTIEVACHGGHGRTGTLLALLAALHQGWPEEEAVSRLREAYCTRAVESKSQERFVREVLKRVRDTKGGGGQG